MSVCQECGMIEGEPFLGTPTCRRFDPKSYSEAKKAELAAKGCFNFLEYRQNSQDFKYKVGDLVIKEGGDYRYYGWVVAAYHKRSGVKRYVVENVDGMNFIFNETQLSRWQEP